jgi:hypothetical protein
MKREGSLVAIGLAPHRGRPIWLLELAVVAWEQSCHNHRIEERVAFRWYRQPMLPPQHVVSSHTRYHNSTATMLSIDSSTADVSWGLEFEQATRGAPDTDLYWR